MVMHATSSQIYVIDKTWNPHMSGKGFEFDADLVLHLSDPTCMHKILIHAHKHN